MKYRILTYKEFEKIAKGEIVSIQKHFLSGKSFRFSHTITSYNITAGDILCLKSSSIVILFFVDEDCVIEFVDYNEERVRHGGKETELFYLTGNKSMSYREAFEIAAL